MSKILVILGVIFQAAGIVWGLWVNFQNHRLAEFFSGPNWPIFLGFALVLIAIFQSVGPKKKEPENTNSTNPFLP